MSAFSRQRKFAFRHSGVKIHKQQNQKSYYTLKELYYLNRKRCKKYNINTQFPKYWELLPKERRGICLIGFIGSMQDDIIQYQTNIIMTIKNK